MNEEAFIKITEAAGFDWDLSNQEIIEKYRDDNDLTSGPDGLQYTYVIHEGNSPYPLKAKLFVKFKNLTPSIGGDFTAFIVGKDPVIYKQLIDCGDMAKDHKRLVDELENIFGPATKKLNEFSHVWRAGRFQAALFTTPKEHPFGTDETLFSIGAVE